MHTIQRIAFVLGFLMAACSTTLMHATAAKDGEEGMRVEVKGGTYSGGVEGRLENVGTWTKIPENWKGPVPPGWYVYEGDAVVPPPKKQ